VKAAYRRHAAAWLRDVTIVATAGDALKAAASLRNVMRHVTSGMPLLMEQ
jgi:hypothetical protein